MSGLTASYRTEAGVTVLALSGAADATTLHTLHRALEDAVLIDPAAAMVVDVGGVVRLSTLALVALVRAGQDADRRGSMLVVCRLGRLDEVPARGARIRSRLVEFAGVTEAVRAVGGRVASARAATAAQHPPVPRVVR